MRITRPHPADGRPRVTVVVPCYRYGRFLPTVVASALGQEGVAVDVIIVDDASPDDSAEVARSLSAVHPQVHVIAHEANAGHIATYNDGLAAATGKYVVLLSADDLLAPGSLARATALMERFPSVGFTYGYCPDFSGEPPEPRHRYHLWTVWPGRAWIKHLCTGAANVVSNPEVVMRRDLLEELGGYDPALPHSADLMLWLRAAARRDVGRVNGPDQAYYRVHGANMHLTDYGDLLSDFAARRTTFDRFVDEDLAGRPDQRPLAERARRTMAKEAVRWVVWGADHDDAGIGRQSDAFLAAAQELWPAITRTGLWRRHVRRSTGAAGLVDRRTFDLGWELRHKIRSRRWRRLGV